MPSAPARRGVHEKLRLEIGGTRQGGFLTGPSHDHPVLLFLHGGPGLPEYPLLRRYPQRLDEDFLVCWWDQRGAGLSYRGGGARPVTVEVLIADAIEVTDRLRERFGQDRIHLLGHSGGSYIGVQVAARAPERFHAYVGMAQMTRQLVSEQRAWRFMRDAYAARGDRRMVGRLDAHPLPDLDTVPDAYGSLRDRAMHELGIGTMRRMRSVVTGIFLPTLRNREYTVSERLDLWRGKWSATSRHLWREMLATDIADVVRELHVPAYFVHGAFDLTVSYDLARAWVTDLVAPVKGFYTFPTSAHSPFLEEPDRLQRILTQDVLRGRTDLADPPGAPGAPVGPRALSADDRHRLT